MAGNTHCAACWALWWAGVARQSRVQRARAGGGRSVDDITKARAAKDGAHKRTAAEAPTTKQGFIPVKIYSDREVFEAASMPQGVPGWAMLADKIEDMLGSEHGHQPMEKVDRRAFMLGAEFGRVLEKVAGGFRNQQAIHLANAARLRSAIETVGLRVEIRRHEGYEGCEEWCTIRVLEP